MENGTTIRLELGIDARKFTQQVMINNEALEDQIKKGIELALNDIVINDNFIEMIRESTKKELRDIVNKSIMSWEIRSKIIKAVEDKIGEKINLFADTIADKITDFLV